MARVVIKVPRCRMPPRKPKRERIALPSRSKAASRKSRYVFFYFFSRMGEFFFRINYSMPITVVIRVARTRVAHFPFCYFVRAHGESRLLFFEIPWKRGLIQTSKGIIAAANPSETIPRCRLHPLLSLRIHRKLTRINISISTRYRPMILNFLLWALLHLT